MRARRVKAISAAVLAAALGACATRGEQPASNNDAEPSRIDETRRGAVDAAQTPLRDIGVIRPDVPDVIETLRYPYSTASLAAGCPAVQYEIGQLDAVLGIESYQPGEETTLTERGLDAASDAAVDVVRDAAGFIPFRGWVRRASGAARAERDAARAIELGHTRRAFLRGYGAALGCRNVTPAPPPSAHNARREDDTPVPTGGVGAPP